MIRCAGVWGEGVLRFVVWKESEDTFKEAHPCLFSLSLSVLYYAKLSIFLQGWRLYVCICMPCCFGNILCVSFSDIFDAPDRASKIR